jgi:stage II sporulation protein D
VCYADRGVRKLLAPLLILASLVASPSAFATNIRVAIVKASTFTIKGMDLVVKDAAGRPVPLPDAYAEVPVTLVKGHITIGGREVEGEPMTLESRSVYFRVGGRQYRELVSVYEDGDKLLAVNTIDLEDYLVGLINHEISSGWPDEAVKAQAIVARSYALYQAHNSRDPRYDLESTVDDQVYGGSQTEDYRSAKAVRETAGEVLVDDAGEVIQAFYSSSCGGITELPQNVWGMTTAITKSVKDPWCAAEPNATWKLDEDADAFGDKLAAGGYAGGTVKSITVAKRSAADRAISIQIVTSRGTVKIGGNELRRVLGYDRLKSARFTVTSSGGVFHFEGKGNGHGVGLCQWGAKGMADAGYSYRQILGNYYPGLYLRNLGDSASR